MVRNPVARDVNGAANPNPIMLEHVVKKFRQALRAAGTADGAVVQGKRHHAWLTLAFAVEHIEGILHVSEKILRGCEGNVAVEAIVVGLVRIWNDQVLSAFDLDPIRQLVVEARS